MYKFEKLEVWKLSIEFMDGIYDIAERLPELERYNLASQITRASTSISLNIAEGSTGQSNAEQNRFLGMALRSLVETVACLKLLERRDYVDREKIQASYESSEKLFAKLTAFRKSINSSSRKRTNTG
ncbi:MAG: four helix bundle protein [Deltaproteobacteria bacterium]|nr:four helix bundle protein [Deltaproteobacteria bacterium]